MLAIAAVLSVIMPFHLPFGGGITLASMLPVVIIAYMYGVKWGLITGFVYSLIQMIFGAGTISAFFLPGESQMNVLKAVSVCLIDYIAAYTILGVAGIFKNRTGSATAEITLGAFVALTGRYIMHIISGAVFFGAWAEWFFSQDGFYKIGEKILSNFSGTALSVVYSVFYNGLYMIPEIILTTVLTPVIWKIVSRSR